MHVGLDEAQMIPEMIHITPAKVSDRQALATFVTPIYQKLTLLMMIYTGTVRANGQLPKP